MHINGKNFGHYELRAAIGAGGMGEIYLASDTRLRRDVAIKILPADLTRDAQAVGRFMREARAASALNHPNILTIYDIGERDGVHFIAAEYVEGKTLREKMQSAALGLAETLDIAVQTANALAAAHRGGIVHRDIKPENIMIRRDGYVKVLDFGIAKLNGLGISDFGFRNEENETIIESPSENPKSQIRNPKLTAPGMILGTVSYMSPEQARGLEIDARSDIFSLGVVIYEMLAGEKPFAGATASDTIAAILEREPPPLARFVKNLPAELEASVAKALQKSPENRYQTAKSLLSDLKRVRQRVEFETELRRESDSTALGEQATRILPPARLSPGRKTRVRRAIDSLAVLPLVNDSRSETAEYFSDGVTECIINSLSKLPKLRVVPRSTVFRYKNRENDLQRIGEELGVRAIFAGRVVHLEDSVIVKAELVDVVNHAQIWGEQYRRKLTDIFALLDDISEDISEKLRLKLTGDEKKSLAKRYTENAEAYQFYLKGRYFVTTKRTEEWIKKGIEYFKKAIDLDPNYALAYSGIAEAYGFLASSTGGWSPRKAYPKARAAALKALELDDALGEAHCSLGFSRLLYEWNFRKAEREFEKAVRLSPNYPNAHDGLGFYLKAVGRHVEAIRECEIARRLDPISPFAHVSLAYAYYFARDYERAIDECEKALEMDRHSTFAYRNLGLSYLQRNAREKALDALGKAVELSGGNPAFDAYLGLAYGLTGRRAEASKLLANLRETARTRYVPAYNFALLHLGLGETDEAFERLEKAFEERSGFVPFLKVEPLFDPLRADSRFSDLLGRVGFPQ